jgi:hypothetical protein
MKRKKGIILILSIFCSIIFPVIILFTFYSLLNFANFIYIGDSLVFLKRNIKIISFIILALIFIIILSKNNLEKYYFDPKEYIMLAIIGQCTNCIIILLIIILAFVNPLIILYFFHLLISQLYFYGLFSNIIVPLIINIVIFMGVSLIVYFISLLLPIKYLDKAIIIYNEEYINIQLDNNIISIRPIKLLLRIIKIKKLIKQSPNVV